MLRVLFAGVTKQRFEIETIEIIAVSVLVLEYTISLICYYFLLFVRCSSRLKLHR